MAERKHHRGGPASALPSRDDIWQAATLLIGVYGREAMEYADTRRTEQQACGDSAGAETWTLIVSQIEHLLRDAPAARLH